MWVRLLLFIFILYSYEIKSQCFSSPGNPIGGTANMGTVKKNFLRIAAFHKYNKSHKYFHEDESLDYNLKEGNYNYSGAIIGYGLREKLTIEAELGYFANKTEVYPILDNKTYIGDGFSNAVFSAKYNFYFNPDKRIEVTASLGGKIPLRYKAQQFNNSDMPIDVQSSTGSYGLVAQAYFIKENSFSGWRFFFIPRYEYFFPNNEEFFKNNVVYHFGNNINLPFIVSKHLWLPWTTGEGIWTAILQVRGEINGKRKENDAVKAASGNYLVYIGPQLNVTIASKWNLSLLFDYPVYQYYNETQLGNNYSFIINLTRDFNFGKKEE